MRDPERLEEFYRQLKNAHKTYFPDWRFGQLLINFAGWMSQKVDPFFPEEDEMLEYIKQFSAGLKEPDTEKARGKK